MRLPLRPTSPCCAPLTGCPLDAPGITGSVVAPVPVPAFGTAAHDFVNSSLPVVTAADASAADRSSPFSVARPRASARASSFCSGGTSATRRFRFAVRRFSRSAFAARSSAAFAFPSRSSSRSSAVLVPAVARPSLVFSSPSCCCSRAFSARSASRSGAGDPPPTVPLPVVDAEFALGVGAGDGGAVGGVGAGPLGGGCAPCPVGCAPLGSVDISKRLEGLLIGCQADISDRAAPSFSRSPFCTAVSRS